MNQKSLSHKIAEFCIQVEKSAKLIKEYVAQFQNLQNRVLKISLDSIYENMRKALLRFEDNIKVIYDVARAYGKLADRFALIMIEMDWPPPMDIYPDQMIKIVEEYDQFGVEKIRAKVNKFLINFYNEKILNEKLISWKNKGWIKKRIPILEAAIKAHIEGKYILSVPTILPQIEGIIADGYGHRGRMDGGQLKLYINSLLSGGNTKTFDKVIRNFFVDTLLAKFEYGSPVKSSLSRHAIIHGADVHYGNVANSLKTILLFDYLQGSFSLV